jgi:hypothetical protein
MAKITIHTRVTLDGKPGEVVGLRKKALSGGGFEYKVKLDGEEDSDWFDLSALLREDGKPVKVRSSVERIIVELKSDIREYKKLIEGIEETGTENLSYEETEDYGAYKGKFEILEMVIKRLKQIKK